MQFQVPQFLDVEDKIIGPFTIKQFIYLAGGVGMGYLAYRFIPFIGWILFLAFLGFGGALGFYKFNSKPLINAIESAMYYFKSDRFYVWRKREKPKDAELDLTNFKPTKHATGILANQNQSKLNDLTWGIDVQQENEVAAQKVHSESGI